MQIIIPMSGLGERFMKAGYQDPKPLIEVAGKPIIEHVVNMFPGEENFIFICNEKHLSNPEWNMRQILKAIAPKGRIVSIPQHKLGPVHAIQSAEHLIDDHEPVMVNYCDFCCYWDWEAFKSFSATKGVGGIIPAYRGAHPHNDGSTNYAYLLNDADRVIDIREKQSFTSQKTQEFASSGSYFFSSGSLLKIALSYVVDNDLSIGNEFYVSLCYKYLLKKGLNISIFELQHFMQWGTPRDLEQFHRWHQSFERLGPEELSQRQLAGHVICPAAGAGSRFSKAGFSKPKPLIEISGSPMVAQANRQFSNTGETVFVIRGDEPNSTQLSSLLSMEFKGCQIVETEALTGGQADTVSLSATKVPTLRDGRPVFIGCCDSWINFDPKETNQIFEKTDVDGIVLASRSAPRPILKPEEYSWIEEANGSIKKVWVKGRPDDENLDLVVVGGFLFSHFEIFDSAFKRQKENAIATNGEFYVDETINVALSMGYNFVALEVQNYISWGTPEELNSFNYWQSCFHKWDGHNYLADNDYLVSDSALPQLKEHFRAFKAIHSHKT